MPRKKSAANAETSILALLTPARRAEILNEVLGEQLRSLLSGAGSVGGLVDALAHHRHWEHLRQLPTSLLLEVAVPAKRAAAAHAPSERAASLPAPAASPHPPAAAPAPPAARSTAPPAAQAPASQKPGKQVRRSSRQIAATVEKVTAFVAKNPGLRSEQIIKQMGGDAKAISDSLARLRAEKKVKTQGIKRAMTYQAA